MALATSTYLNRPRRSLVEAIAQRCVDALHWYGATYATHVYELCSAEHCLSLDQQAAVVDHYHRILNRTH